MSQVSISDCRICKQLSSYNYADLTYAPIPAHIASLTGDSPTSLADNAVVRCPVCNTFYRYNYSCGFAENDIELRRISPVEAGAQTDVERFRRELTSDDLETQSYAAKCLMEYYLAHEQALDAEGLLKSDNDNIRSSAVASQAYFKYHQKLQE